MLVADICLEHMKYCDVSTRKVGSISLRRHYSTLDDARKRLICIDQYCCSLDPAQSRPWFVVPPLEFVKHPLGGRTRHLAREMPDIATG